VTLLFGGHPRRDGRPERADADTPRREVYRWGMGGRMPASHRCERGISLGPLAHASGLCSGFAHSDLDRGPQRRPIARRCRRI
jgi:hypothetical protein